MTSSAPPDDFFLEALCRAGNDACPPLGADRVHDIAEARRMSPAERLATLNELMMLVEGLGIAPRVEESVSCGALRL
jgi:hypothetical protein